MSYMASGGRVLFVHLGDPPRLEPVRTPHQSRPKTLVDESDLPVDAPAHQDVRRIAQISQDPENLAAFRVAPPAPGHGCRHNSLCDRRNGSFGGCENYPKLKNECQRLLESHPIQTS